MTTYRTIAGTETQPEAPITAALMTALALNPTATMEGASGAPRLQFAALDTWFTTAGAIGTLAFLGQSGGTTTTIVAGTTYAGSGLKYAGFDIVSGLQIAGATPSGTWLALSTVTTAGVQTRAGLFLRVS